MVLIDVAGLWAGSAQGLMQLREASDHLWDKWGDAQLQASTAQVDDEVTPYQVTDNGTAIIGIKGHLINRDLPDWITSYLGVTCYPALQRAFAQAAQDTSVKRVLLDVNSGGGAVSGLYDTVEALNQLKAVKPVATYASDVACSAAYWLGSVGKPFAHHPASVVGSIGVISVHLVEKKALQNEGIEPYVFRAGDKKHLAHSLEDLTEEGRNSIKAQLDFTHAHFLDAVSQHRNLPLVAVRAVGDGTEFLGHQAVDVGLADKITTFNEFLAEFEAQDELKPKQTTYQFNTNSGFAAGVETVNLQEAMARISELETAQLAEKQALTAAEARAATAEAELAAVKASNVAMATSLAEAEKQREAHCALLDSSIATMATAMGVETLIPDDLSGKQAYHDKLQEKFQAKFPSGGVAVANNAAAQAGQENNLPDWWNKVVKG